tara:strand:- start:94 stop:609 length:516 start_codon:yes stop_codon:yes gene_type:complete
MLFEIPKILAKSKCHYDRRGYLQEIYLRKEQKQNFKFSILTSSKKNVFRGFHFQIRKQQAKLVYIVKGKILDIAIDLRRKSKNFRKTYKFNLKEKDILYIPKGFAHGYLSLASENIVLYYMTDYRDAKSETGIVWNDKMLNIKFPIKKIKVSRKDKKLKTLKNFLEKYKSL